MLSTTWDTGHDRVTARAALSGVSFDDTPGFFAGVVDVVGFVSLFGMFTSHFTGNFVVIGKEIVDHSLCLIAELIALPVFVVVVAATRLVALRYERNDRSPLRALLLIQTALLAACMLMGVAASPVTNAAATSAILASQLGIAAMAVQNAYGRLVFHAHAPTTVMTTNTTQAAIDFVDMYRGVPGLSEQARDRFERTAPIILAFVAGVVAGAYRLSRLFVLVPDGPRCRAAPGEADCCLS